MLNRPIPVVKKKRVPFLTSLRQDGALYLLALPGVILLVLFNYLPLSGLLLAFKDYNFAGGIFGSPWADPLFRNFKFFFNSIDTAFRSVRNTIMINLCCFAVGSVISIAIAVMLTELKKKWYVKVTQSLMFFPYFVSWTVLGAILNSALLKVNGGFVNQVINALGGKSLQFYMNPWYWLPIIVLCVSWQSCGYNSIIYYGVLTGIDPALYEAAQVDGATKWQQIIHISLPMIWPTFVTLFLLMTGNMLKGNLAMIMGLTTLNPLLLEVTDVIDVYVYRSSLKLGEISLGSAISLFQSVFGFFLILTVNTIIHRADRDLALF